MNKLFKSKYIIFFVFLLAISFQPFMGAASVNAFEELPERYFEVLVIESPDYKSKDLKTIYDFYKIDEELFITEQFEKVAEGMKKKPPGVVVLQPSALDIKYRGIAEFNELDPIALKRGAVTTLSLKYNDEMAVASRNYVVDLELYLDETLASGVGFNAISSFIGYDIV